MKPFQRPHGKTSGRHTATGCPTLPCPPSAPRRHGTGKVIYARPQHGVVHRQPVRKVEPCLSFCGLGGRGRRHQFTGGVEHVRLHGQFFHPFQSVVHFGDYRQVRTSLADLLADIYPGRSIIQRRDASLGQQQDETGR